MKVRVTLIKLVAAAILALAAVFALVLLRGTSGAGAAVWQRQASPGELSAAHSFLADNCAACHTPYKGVEAANCAACHADNRELLARKPTAFHAHASGCSECHLEHQGAGRPPAQMDHIALAGIGLRELDEAVAGSEQQLARGRLLDWRRAAGARAVYPNVTPEEMILNCAACHDTKDRHAGLFGKDCAECHATSQWTLPEFVHPSPRSTSCAECHQAPPSHYMEHFEMVSKRVARVEHAQVNQCYLCHQTTSWNDIKGVGWYKHH